MSAVVTRTSRSTQAVCLPCKWEGEKHPGNGPRSHEMAVTDRDNHNAEQHKEPVA